jgi:hypothetical protein
VVKRQKVITHEFVDTIPQQLDEGKLYISIPFATTVHKCFCGCGNEVVAPLSPTDWKLTFDGASVSLDPSIGNWSFPCRSHYWIDRSRIMWAPRWTRGEIEAGRRRDALAKRSYYLHKGNSLRRGEVDDTGLDERGGLRAAISKMLRRWFS